MAAAALEQSILESKDKDTLLEMAKALGVKVNARLKKGEIIDKILDTTGSGSSSAPPAAAEPSAPAEAGGSPRRDHAPSNGDSPNRDAAGGASSVDTSSNGNASRDNTSSADADSPNTDDDASSDLIATPVRHDRTWRRCRGAGRRR